MSCASLPYMSIIGWLIISGSGIPAINIKSPINTDIIAGVVNIFLTIAFKSKVLLTIEYPSVHKRIL